MTLSPPEIRTLVALSLLKICLGKYTQNFKPHVCMSFEPAIEGPIALTGLLK